MAARPAPGHPSHVTTVVRAPAYCNSFALCYEMPIPWTEILSAHEKILLGYHTCCAGLELIFHKHDCLAEPQRWRLHCHCDDPQSLQCLSGKHVIKNVVLDFIKGARVNRLQLWFREFINSGRPDEITYVGSVMYNGVHFLYFRLCFTYDVQQACLDLIRTCLSPEMGMLIRGTFGHWLVLTCDMCALHKLGCLKRCAVKTRRIIKTMLDAIENMEIVTFSYLTSRGEERRRSALRQAMLYGRCRSIRNLAEVTMGTFLHV
ncbi:E4-34K [Bat mastadenovirus A]|uniref:E4-34K n=1 Tax=Bat mastadenovirus A TaxID=1146877 RepID=A0A3G9EDY3_9ADEN|nr:E4-34K [Bat mastadenovirus A]